MTDRSEAGVVTEEEAGTSSRLRRIGAAAIVVITLVLLTIANTWPLLPNLDRALSDPGDPLILTWTLHHDWVATTHAPSQLFQAPIFWPSKYALAFSEHVYGIALFTFPLFAAGLPPITVYNIAMLAGFILSGLSAYLLCRVAGASRFGAWCGAIFFAFVPYRFSQLPHLQHIWSLWVPLSLAALLHYAKRPTWRNAALFGLAFLFNGLTNVHLFLFGSVTVGATLLLILAMRRLQLRALTALIVAGAIAMLLLLPFLLPYKKVQKMYDMDRSRGEVAYYSAEWSDWLRTARENHFYRDTTMSRQAQGERALFPGFAVLLLSFAAFYFRSSRRRDSEQPRLVTLLDAATIVCLVLTTLGVMSERVNIPLGRCALLSYQGSATFLALTLLLFLTRLWIAYPESLRPQFVSLRESMQSSERPESALSSWSALLWIVLGVIGSLGFNAFLHAILYGRIEAFRAIRVPARWAIITYIGLAVASSLGVSAITQRMGGRGRRVFISTLIVIFLLLELRAAPLRWYLFDVKPAPLHVWLKEAPLEGAMIEFPFVQGWSDYESMYRSTFHGRPIVNGVSGFVPPSQQRIIDRVASGRTTDLVDVLQRYRVPLIVVHEDQLLGQHKVVHAWLARETSAGRIVLLRRFDEGLGGAWVFALRSLITDAQLEKLAYSTASQRAMMQAAFLAGDAMTPATTFGHLDLPVESESIQGRLSIFGWALSPHGVRAVHARFANGRKTVELTRMPYDVLKKHYPAGGDQPNPAFGAVLPEPPGGARENDLEITVTDGRGVTSRLAYVTFQWKPDRQFCAGDWRKPRLRQLVSQLGGSPDDAKGIIAGSRTIQDVVKGYIERSSQWSDSQFVQQFHRITMREAPSREELAATLAKMRRGTSREDVTRAILNSDRFARWFLSSAVADPNSWP
jgi:hypothetical protein